MKTIQKIILLTTVLLILSFPRAYAKTDSINEAPASGRILILGLNDNIRSDYYYKGLIAEESGIPEDSLEVVFNRIISANIAQSRVAFIPVVNTEKCTNVLANIKVKGEQDECTADLSKVDNQCFKDLLTTAGAEYVLILNRHFLRKQDEPFNTIFYFISYSLYNKEKTEISSGSNYFTAMHLESAETMKKTSRKTSDKIASAILKLVAQQPAPSAALLLSKN